MGSFGYREIPYGVGDFELVMREEMFYLDKTRFILELERAARFNFLVRPRRFGKSIFCGMLHCYYDINRKERFDELFHGTWIHSHPTSERGAHLVLALNFSAVNPDIRKVENSFNSYCNCQMRYFAKEYEHLLPAGFEATLKEDMTATGCFNELLTQCRNCGLSIYLIIDEYDNFANTILATEGEDAYKNLTHGAGFFKHFFALFKAGATGAASAVRRMFVTGVSPVTMDDVTSGCNIGTNLSLHPRFNEAMGFMDADVDAALDEYEPQIKLPMSRLEIKALLDKWYAGYRFCRRDDAALIYNTDMILYFLNAVVKDNEPPEEMIDHNVRIDYAKLRHLMLVSRKLNGNFSTINEIAEGGAAVSPILDSFPMEALKDRESFISLLHYFGLLSFRGTIDGIPALAVPNETMRSLFYNYVRGAYNDVGALKPDVYTLGKLLNRLAYHGEWRPVFDLFAKALSESSSIRDYIQGETFVKAFLLSYMNLHDYFVTHSEPEMSKGFADIVLVPFMMKYPGSKFGCVIEAKYLKRDMLTDASLAAALSEARAQLLKYNSDPRMAQRFAKCAPILLTVVFHGWEIAACERVEP